MSWGLEINQTTQLSPQSGGATYNVSMSITASSLGLPFNGQPTDVTCDLPNISIYYRLDPSDDWKLIHTHSPSYPLIGRTLMITNDAIYPFSFKNISITDGNGNFSDVGDLTLQFKAEIKDLDNTNFPEQGVNDALMSSVYPFLVKSFQVDLLYIDLINDIGQLPYLNPFLYTLPNNYDKFYFRLKYTDGTSVNFETARNIRVKYCLGSDAVCEEENNWDSHGIVERESWAQIWNFLNNIITETMTVFKIRIDGDTSSFGHLPIKNSYIMNPRRVTPGSVTFTQDENEDYPQYDIVHTGLLDNPVEEEFDMTGFSYSMVVTTPGTIGDSWVYNQVSSGLSSHTESNYIHTTSFSLTDLMGQYLIFKPSISFTCTGLDGNVGVRNWFYPNESVFVDDLIPITSTISWGEAIGGSLPDYYLAPDITVSWLHVTGEDPTSTKLWKRYRTGQSPIWSDDEAWELLSDDLDIASGLDGTDTITLSNEFIDVENLGKITEYAVTEIVGGTETEIKPGSPQVYHPPPISDLTTSNFSHVPSELAFTCNSTIIPGTATGSEYQNSWPVEYIVLPILNTQTPTGNPTWTEPFGPNDPGVFATNVQWNNINIGGNGDNVFGNTLQKMLVITKFGDPGNLAGNPFPGFDFDMTTNTNIIEFMLPLNTEGMTTTVNSLYVSGQHELSFYIQDSMVRNADFDQVEFIVNIDNGDIIVDNLVANAGEWELGTTIILPDREFNQEISISISYNNGTNDLVLWADPTFHLVSNPPSLIMTPSINEITTTIETNNENPDTCYVIIDHIQINPNDGIYPAWTYTDAPLANDANWESEQDIIGGNFPVFSGLNALGGVKFRVWSKNGGNVNNTLGYVNPLPAEFTSVTYPNAIQNLNYNGVSPTNTLLTWSTLVPGSGDYIESNANTYGDWTNPNPIKLQYSVLNFETCDFNSEYSDIISENISDNEYSNPNDIDFSIENFNYIPYFGPNYLHVNKWKVYQEYLAFAPSDNNQSEPSFIISYSDPAPIDFEPIFTVLDDATTMWAVYEENISNNSEWWLTTIVHANGEPIVNGDGDIISIAEIMENPDRVSYYQVSTYPGSNLGSQIIIECESPDDAETIETEILAQMSVGDTVWISDVTANEIQGAFTLDTIGESPFNGSFFARDTSTISLKILEEFTGTSSNITTGTFNFKVILGQGQGLDVATIGNPQYELTTEVDVPFTRVNLTDGDMLALFNHETEDHKKYFAIRRNKDNSIIRSMVQWTTPEGTGELRSSNNPLTIYDTRAFDSSIQAPNNIILESTGPASFSLQWENHMDSSFVNRFEIDQYKMIKTVEGSYDIDGTGSHFLLQEVGGFDFGAVVGDIIVVENSQGAQALEEGEFVITSVEISGNSLKVYTTPGGTVGDNGTTTFKIRKSENYTISYRPSYNIDQAFYPEINYISEASIGVIPGSSLAIELRTIYYSDFDNITTISSFNSDPTLTLFTQLSPIDTINLKDSEDGSTPKYWPYHSIEFTYLDSNITDWQHNISGEFASFPDWAVEKEGDNYSLFVSSNYSGFDIHAETITIGIRGYDSAAQAYTETTEYTIIKPIDGHEAMNITIDSRTSSAVDTTFNEINNNAMGTAVFNSRIKRIDPDAADFTDNRYVYTASHLGKIDSGDLSNESVNLSFEPLSEAGSGVPSYGVCSDSSYADKGACDSNIDNKWFDFPDLITITNTISQDLKDKLLLMQGLYITFTSAAGGTFELENIPILILKAVDDGANDFKLYISPGSLTTVDTFDDCYILYDGHSYSGSSPTVGTYFQGLNSGSKHELSIVPSYKLDSTRDDNITTIIYQNFESYTIGDFLNWTDGTNSQIALGVFQGDISGADATETWDPEVVDDGAGGKCLSSTLGTDTNASSPILRGPKISLEGHSTYTISFKYKITTGAQWTPSSSDTIFNVYTEIYNDLCECNYELGTCSCSSNTNASANLGNIKYVENHGIFSHSGAYETTWIPVSFEVDNYYDDVDAIAKPFIDGDIFNIAMEFLDGRTQGDPRITLLVDDFKVERKLHTKHNYELFNQFSMVGDTEAITMPVNADLVPIAGIASVDISASLPSTKSGYEEWVIYITAESDIISDDFTLDDPVNNQYLQVLGSTGNLYYFNIDFGDVMEWNSSEFILSSPEGILNLDDNLDFWWPESLGFNDFLTALGNRKVRLSTFSRLTIDYSALSEHSHSVILLPPVAPDGIEFNDPADLYQINIDINDSKNSPLTEYKVMFEEPDGTLSWIGDDPPGAPFEMVQNEGEAVRMNASAWSNAILSGLEHNTKYTFKAKVLDRENNISQDQLSDEFGRFTLAAPLASSPTISDVTNTSLKVTFDNPVATVNADLLNIDTKYFNDGVCSDGTNHNDPVACHANSGTYTGWGTVGSPTLEFGQSGTYEQNAKIGGIGGIHVTTENGQSDYIWTKIDLSSADPINGYIYIQYDYATGPGSHVAKISLTRDSDTENPITYSHLIDQQETDLYTELTSQIEYGLEDYNGSYIQFARIPLQIAGLAFNTDSSLTITIHPDWSGTSSGGNPLEISVSNLYLDHTADPLPFYDFINPPMTKYAVHYASGDHSGWKNSDWFPWMNDGSNATGTSQYSNFIDVTGLHPGETYNITFTSKSGDVTFTDEDIPQISSLDLGQVTTLIPDVADPIVSAPLDSLFQYKQIEFEIIPAQVSGVDLDNNVEYAIHDASLEFCTDALNVILLDEGGLPLYTNSSDCIGANGTNLWDNTTGMYLQLNTGGPGSDSYRLWVPQISFGTYSQWYAHAETEKEYSFSSADPQFMFPDYIPDSNSSFGDGPSFVNSVWDYSVLAPPDLVGNLKSIKPGTFTAMMSLSPVGNPTITDAWAAYFNGGGVYTNVPPQENPWDVTTFTGVNPDSGQIIFSDDISLNVLSSQYSDSIFEDLPVDEISPDPNFPHVAYAIIPGGSEDAKYAPEMYMLLYNNDTKQFTIRMGDQSVCEDDGNTTDGICNPWSESLDLYDTLGIAAGGSLNGICSDTNYDNEIDCLATGTENWTAQGHSYAYWAFWFTYVDETHRDTVLSYEGYDELHSQLHELYVIAKSVDGTETTSAAIMEHTRVKAIDPIEPTYTVDGSNYVITDEVSFGTSIDDVNDSSEILYKIIIKDEDGIFYSVQSTVATPEAGFPQAIGQTDIYDLSPIVISGLPGTRAYEIAIHVGNTTGSMDSAYQDFYTAPDINHLSVSQSADLTKLNIEFNNGDANYPWPQVKDDPSGNDIYCNYKVTNKQYDWDGSFQEKTIYIQYWDPAAYTTPGTNGLKWGPSYGGYHDQNIFTNPSSGYSSWSPTSFELDISSRSIEENGDWDTITNLWSEPLMWSYANCEFEVSFHFKWGAGGVELSTAPVTYTTLPVAPTIIEPHPAYGTAISGGFCIGASEGNEVACHAAGAAWHTTGELQDPYPETDVPYLSPALSRFKIGINRYVHKQIELSTDPAISYLSNFDNVDKHIIYFGSESNSIIYFSIKYYTNSGADVTLSEATPADWMNHGVDCIQDDGAFAPEWSKVQAIEIKNENSFLVDTPDIYKIEILYTSKYNDVPVGSAINIVNDSPGNPMLSTIDRDASGGLFRIELDNSQNSYLTDVLLELKDSTNTTVHTSSANPYPGTYYTVSSLNNEWEEYSVIASAQDIAGANLISNTSIFPTMRNYGVTQWSSPSENPQGRISFTILDQEPTEYPIEHQNDIWYDAANRVLRTPWLPGYNFEWQNSNEDLIAGWNIHWHIKPNTTHTFMRSHKLFLGDDRISYYVITDLEGYSTEEYTTAPYPLVELTGEATTLGPGNDLALTLSYDYKNSTYGNVSSFVLAFDSAHDKFWNKTTLSFIPNTLATALSNSSFVFDAAWIDANIMIANNIIFLQGLQAGIPYFFEVGAVNLIDDAPVEWTIIGQFQQGWTTNNMIIKENFGTSLGNSSYYVGDAGYNEYIPTYFSDTDGKVRSLLEVNSYKLSAIMADNIPTKVYSMNWPSPKPAVYSSATNEYGPYHFKFYFTEPENSTNLNYRIRVGDYNHLYKDTDGTFYPSNERSIVPSLHPNTDGSFVDNYNVPLIINQGFKGTFTEWNNGEVLIKYLTPNTSYKLYIEAYTEINNYSEKLINFSTIDIVIPLKLGSNTNFDGTNIYSGNTYAGINPIDMISLNDMTDPAANYIHPDGAGSYDSTGNLFNDNEENFLLAIAANINVPGGEYDPSLFEWDTDTIVAPNNTCTETLYQGSYIDNATDCDSAGGTWYSDDTFRIINYTKFWLNNLYPETFGRIQEFSGFAQGANYELEVIPSLFNSLIYASSIDLITDRLNPNTSFLSMPTMDKLFTNNIFDEEGIETSLRLCINEVTKEFKNLQKLDHLTLQLGAVSEFNSKVPSFITDNKNLSTLSFSEPSNITDLSSLDLTKTPRLTANDKLKLIYSEDIFSNVFKYPENCCNEVDWVRADGDTYKIKVDSLIPLPQCMFDSIMGASWTIENYFDINLEFTADHANDKYKEYSQETFVSLGVSIPNTISEGTAVADQGFTTISPGSYGVCYSSDGIIQSSPTPTHEGACLSLGDNMVWTPTQLRSDVFLSSIDPLTQGHFDSVGGEGYGFLLGWEYKYYNLPSTTTGVSSVKISTSFDFDGDGVTETDKEIYNSNEEIIVLDGFCMRDENFNDNPEGCCGADGGNWVNGKCTVTTFWETQGICWENSLGGNYLGGTGTNMTAEHSNYWDCSFNSHHWYPTSTFIHSPLYYMDIEYPAINKFTGEELYDKIGIKNTFSKPEILAQNQYLDNEQNQIWITGAGTAFGTLDVFLGDNVLISEFEILTNTDTEYKITAPNYAYLPAPNYKVFNGTQTDPGDEILISTPTNLPNEELILLEVPVEETIYITYDGWDAKFELPISPQNIHEEGTGPDPSSYLSFIGIQFLTDSYKIAEAFSDIEKTKKLIVSKNSTAANISNNNPSGSVFNIYGYPEWTTGDLEFDGKLYLHSWELMPAFAPINEMDTFVYPSTIIDFNFSIANAWVAVTNTYPEATFNIPEVLPMEDSAFVAELIDLNSWNGIIRGGARYNGESAGLGTTYNLDGLPCTVGKPVGDLNYEGVCYEYTWSWQEILSAGYPLNALAELQGSLASYDADGALKTGLHSFPETSQGTFNVATWLYDEHTYANGELAPTNYSVDYYSKGLYAKYSPTLFDKEGHIVALYLQFNGQMKYVPASLNTLPKLEHLIYAANDDYTLLTMGKHNVEDTGYDLIPNMIGANINYVAFQDNPVSSFPDLSRYYSETNIFVALGLPNIDYIPNFAGWEGTLVFDSTGISSNVNAVSMDPGVCGSFIFQYIPEAFDLYLQNWGCTTSIEADLQNSYWPTSTSTTSVRIQGYLPPSGYAYKLKVTDKTSGYVYGLYDSTNAVGIDDDYMWRDLKIVRNTMHMYTTEDVDPLTSGSVILWGGIQEANSHAVKSNDNAFTFEVVDHTGASLATPLETTFFNNYQIPVPSIVRGTFSWSPVSGTSDWGGSIASLEVTYNGQFYESITGPRNIYMGLVNETTATVQKVWLAGDSNNDLSFVIPAGELYDDFVIAMSYSANPVAWGIGNWLSTTSATQGYLLNPLRFNFGDS